MIDEVIGIAGGAFVLAALASKRITVSISLLFIGSLLIGFTVAEHAGPIAGIVVSSLYAGALITLILVSLMAVPRSGDVKTGTLFYVALAFSSLTALVLLYMFSTASFSPKPALTRSISEEDAGAVILVLVSASIGIVTVLRGGKE